jgi:hypothetical protein
MSWGLGARQTWGCHVNPTARACVCSRTGWSVAGLYGRRPLLAMARIER